MRIEFDFCVSARHPSLPGHFPDKAVVPGVVLLDHVMIHLRAVTGQRVTQLRQVKFTSPALPDEQTQVECEFVDARVSFRATTPRDGALIELVTGTLSLHSAEGLAQ